MIRSYTEGNENTLLSKRLLELIRVLANTAGYNSEGTKSTAYVSPKKMSCKITSMNNNYKILNKPWYFNEDVESLYKGNKISIEEIE